MNETLWGKIPLVEAKLIDIYSSLKLPVILFHFFNTLSHFLLYFCGEKIKIF